MYKQHSFGVETSKVPYSNHAVMAMEAARSMTNTRQKLKTGHFVCYHLLKMLKNGDAIKSSDFSVGKEKMKRVPVNDRVQFSLGF